MENNTGKFKSGRPAWNKGLSNWWNKGVPRPKSVREKISESHKKLTIKRGRSPQPKIDVLCKQCGNYFGVIKSRIGRAKFCSKKCYSLNQLKWIPHNKENYTSKTYGGFHYKVRKLRGIPSVCEICGTTKSKKFEWANMTGKYGDINDYKRMCCSCHKKHDKIINNLSR